MGASARAFHGAFTRICYALAGHRRSVVWLDGQSYLTVRQGAPETPAASTWQFRTVSRRNDSAKQVPTKCRGCLAHSQSRAGAHTIISDTDLGPALNCSFKKKRAAPPWHSAGLRPSEATPPLWVSLVAGTPFAVAGHAKERTNPDFPDSLGRRLGVLAPAWVCASERKPQTVPSLSPTLNVLLRPPLRHEAFANETSPQLLKKQHTMW